MLKWVKRSLIALVGVAGINATAQEMSNLKVESFPFNITERSTFQRDDEMIRFIFENGFGFHETQVLFDEDIDLHIYSDYALLVDLTTNEVIFNRNADKKAYPASLTKMMTVLVGLENVNQETMTIRADFDRLFVEGAAIAGFRNGDIVSTKDVLMATMLPSGADAVETLAYHVAGSEAAFVELMNERAQQLGMNDTHFANASGLHDDNHYTTARDMAVLVRVALKNQEWREIFSAKYHDTEMGLPLRFTSRMFDRMNTSEFNGVEVLGGKTGYTWEALLCLASFATAGGHEFALITMHADGGPRTPQYHVIDAVNIYDYFLGD